MINDPAFLYSYRLAGDGKGVKVDVDTAKQWPATDGSLWLHIDVSDRASCDWLRRQSGVPAAVVDVLLADETRPRSAATDQGLLIIVRGVNTNPGEDPEDMVSVRLWLEAGRIISTRRRRLLSVVDIASALDDGQGPRTPSELFTMLLERIADRVGSFVESIDDRLDEAEDNGSKEQPAAVRRRVATLRRQIAAVRRFLAPQRDALDRLNRQSPFLDEPDLHALRQESDRITRYLEDLDLARERAIVLQEELLGEIAQQQNSRMYVLSVVAAVFLPLTFVTGLLGMNVGGLPGVEDDAGFAWSMLVMLLSGVSLLAFFRWKNWL